jgi:hypothetical protein
VDSILAKVGTSRKAAKVGTSRKAAKVGAQGPCGHQVLQL